MNTFKRCTVIRNTIIKRAAEVMTYGWSPEFCTKEIREIPELIRQCDWYSPIDPNDLSADEMTQLGFHRWSEGSPMMLIPLWLHAFLTDELQASCIDGESRITKREEIDTDNRGGFLAWGVTPQ